MMKFAWLLAAGTTFALSTFGFEPSDYSFLLSATANANPPQITITWPQKFVGPITVRRKLPSDSNWTATVGNLPGDAASFVDRQVQAGVAYEYEFSARLRSVGGSIDGPFAYGYICAGAEIPAVENRGRVVLIVDNRFTESLRAELETLRNDLVGDGWTVLRHDVSAQASPPTVRQLIQSAYNADPAKTRAVFLFGHVPVPYSGLLNPDMHREHIGAWPADVYYGDVDGVWTDSTVNKPDAQRPENRNVPGDGKFDQSTIPSAVELQVGRVDLSNLSLFAGRTELDLLRNYLRKNHEFRQRIFSAPPRAIIRDNFGIVQDDAPAADAWRAFPALLGPQSWQVINNGEFFPVLNQQPYLWAFGCGGGSFDEADGIGETIDFANNDPKAVFYLLHGSYFGDWDGPNNFLRAAIATRNYGLVSIWSSLPHWYFHHLALGETIGYATRLVQNNRQGVYRNHPDYSLGEVHISMMGDPTLRPFQVAPPRNVRSTRTDKLTLTWDPSTDPALGYHIYRAPGIDAVFTKVSASLISGTTFETTLPVGGRHVYMVRAEKLETTGSGSFRNLSQGAFIEVDSGVVRDSVILKPTFSRTGEFAFTASGFPNRRYRVESRTFSGNWRTRESGVAGDSGTITYRETNVVSGVGEFYRVVWE